jgi:cytochrome c peroxidase
MHGNLVSPLRPVSITASAVALLLALGPLSAEGPLPLPGPLPAVRHPADNPATEAKIALGRELFGDPGLSRTGQVACASCHDPQRGFSNGQRFGIGVEGRAGTRNVPGLVNVAYHRTLFWDGRAGSLEEQALAPIRDAREMDMDLDALVARLNALPGYRRQFQAAFGGQATAARLAQALAAFQRTLIVADTPFDRYQQGDRQALGPAALRGMELFFGQARCALCHKGPNFSDDEFHHIGVPDDGVPDPGRRAVTGRPGDQGKFRTPGLRDVGRTAPYMHNGAFATLHAVVEHYNFGGVTGQANDHRDELLRVLYLNETQVDDLVAFLAEGLTRQVRE